MASLRPYLFFHIPGSRYFQIILSDRNEYRINSMGFRGPEFSPLPAPGKKRLLVIGDSIVEGHGVAVDRTFARHLGYRLAARGWDVLNLGVQGASPLYFAANLERYLALHPDAVLMVVHENDLYDDELREQSYFSLPLLQDREGLCSGGRTHSPATASALYALLENGWRTLRRTPVEKIIAGNLEVPGIHEDRPGKRNMSSFAVPPEKFDRRWAMSSRYLSHALDAFREKDIAVAVSSLCTVTLSFPAVRSYTEHCRSLEAHAAEWAREKGVPFLSLVPVMEKALTTHALTEVLILNDFHPTAMTHSLLAEALYPFLGRHLPAGE